MQFNVNYNFWNLSEKFARSWFRCFSLEQCVWRWIAISLIVEFNFSPLYIWFLIFWISLVFVLWNLFRTCSGYLCLNLCPLVTITTLHKWTSCIGQPRFMMLNSKIWETAICTVKGLVDQFQQDWGMAKLDMVGLTFDKQPPPWGFTVIVFNTIYALCLYLRCKTNSSSSKMSALTAIFLNLHQL